ncbi:MAG TPA: hypothetical protein VN494_10035 [Patescibacteria group bacterium]|nr:hypothetical protein [Patescibacteria group bacterium]
MGETEKPGQFLDSEIQEDKAVYQRPTLRRIGWLRDVTAGGASNDT